MRPLVVLDHPPGGKWNWQRIFPRDTTPKPPSQQAGVGRLAALHQRDGHRGPADRPLAVASARDACSAARARQRRFATALARRRTPDGPARARRISESRAARLGHRARSRCCGSREPGLKHQFARGRRRCAMRAYPVPSAGGDRARSQGHLPVQQRLGVVEGRVRRAAEVEGDRRRHATASTAATCTLDAAQRPGELRRHALGVSAAARRTDTASSTSS